MGKSKHTSHGIQTVCRRFVQTNVHARQVVERRRPHAATIVVTTVPHSDTNGMCAGAVLLHGAADNLALQARRLAGTQMGDR